MDRDIKTPSPTTAPRITPDAGASYFTPQRVTQWLSILLWTGLAVRSLRFLLKFPLWEDECFLCVNLIDQNFGNLLGGLRYHQVAPPLFLLLQNALVKLFGFSEWSLRLLPFAASIASLFLFRRLLVRNFSGPVALLAFGLFAVSYPGIRYAAEAKQYATDLFAALVMFTLAAEWKRSQYSRWLFVAALAAPVLTWLSYPAVFVQGAVSLAVLVTLVTSQKLSDEAPTTNRFQRLKSSLATQCNAWWAWAALNFLILAGFASVYFVIKRQSTVDLGFMANYWQSAFPPLATPTQLPGWFLMTHLSDLVAWPVGGGNGASAATGILAAIGVWQLLRKRETFWPVLLLMPAVLNLVAAALQRYPYGGHVKFSMYLGPTVCLLAGWGAVAWNEWTRQRAPQLAHRSAFVTLLLLLTIAGASAARDIYRPSKTLSDERARSFAQWFWFNAELEGTTVAVDSFSGQPFSQESQQELTWTATFLCNKAIYAPNTTDAPLLPPDQQPLRCVIYRDPRFTYNAARIAAWKTSLQSRYTLESKVTYPFIRFDKGERKFIGTDYVDIYTFQPRINNLKTAYRATKNYE